MANPPEESPFATFAAPKRSAVAEWRERRQQARATKRKALRGTACAGVGSAGGAAIGLSLSVGFGQLLYVLLGAMAGAVLGLAAGVALGCACFSVMAMTGTSRKPSYEAELARRDPMAVIKVLMFAFALIGMTLGSAGGGLEGLAWGGRPQRADAALPWAFLGSILGLAVAGIAWLLWEVRRKTAGDPDGVPAMGFPEAETGGQLPEPLEVVVPQILEARPAAGDLPGDQFDWQALAPGDKHYQLALEEFHVGRSFPEIVAILGERGLSPELIPEVSTALANNRAFYLLSAGKSVAEVRDILAERGLSRADAEYIARTAAGSRERVHASMGLGKWQTRSLVAGGVLLTVGVVLYALKRLAVVDVPGELIMGLLASGVVLAGIGGLYIAFGVRP